jgi:ferredoxin-type protein NapH
LNKLRQKIQLGFLVLFNLGIVQWHFLSFPVLNCHSCPISIFSCPMGIIGQCLGVSLIPLSVIGVLGLAGLTAGRFLCGWACPFGYVQDLLYKVPYTKFSIPSWFRFVKYGVFLCLVVAVPIFLSTESRLYFCRLCPVGTIESAIPWAIMRDTTDFMSLSIRLSVLMGITILVMGHRRFFCKVLCPLGACLSVFSRFAAVFPQRDSSCVECGSCIRVCPMDNNDPSTKAKAEEVVFENRPEECIACLECWKKCPTNSIHLWG